jgi:hypothetical protein
VPLIEVAEYALEMFRVELKRKCMVVACDVDGKGVVAESAHTKEVEGREDGAKSLVVNM